MTFRVDGRVTGTITPKSLKPGQQWVYDQPMFMILNLAVGGWSGTPAHASSSGPWVIDSISYRPS